MHAGDPAEALGENAFSEEVIGGLRRSVGCDAARTDHRADYS